MKTMPKPHDFDNFGRGRVGEYFTKLSRQNVWRKYEKQLNRICFSFQTKMHGTFDMGAWCVKGFLTKRMA